MPQNKTYDLAANLGGPGGTSIQPDVAAVSDSSTTTGDYVDTRGGEGPVQGYFACGAAGGGPTSFTLTCTLRQADDSAGSTNEEAISTQSTLTLTSDDEHNFMFGLHARRYVACRVAASFTGGSSPTISIFGAVLIQDKSY